MNSSDMRIAKGMLVVTMFMFLGKLVSALKEITIAANFGVGAIVDTYVFAFVIVLWLPSLVASIFQTSLVPILRRSDEKNRELFISELTGVVVLFSISVVTLVYLYLPELFNILPGSLKEQDKNRLIPAVRLLLPLLLFQFLVSIYSAQLLALEKHANTLFEAIPAAVIIIVLWLFASVYDGLNALLIATVAGVFCQLSVLWICVSRYKSLPTFKLGFKSTNWYEFRRAASLLAGGAFFTSLIIPVDNWLASTQGEGSISILSYATRILGLIVAIGVTVVSRALLPVLSDSSANLDTKLLATKRWALLVFFVGVCASLLLFVLANTLIKIFFERGSFTESNTAMVSEVFKIGLLQIPFLFSGMVFVQFFAVTKKQGIIAISGLIAVFVKISSGFWFISLFGLSGLMFSTTLMYISTLSFFIYCFKKYSQNKS